MLTQERLKELFSYNPKTGIFIRLTNRYRWKKGSVAGTLTNGYIRIKIDHVLYQAHRLAFLYMEGEFPANIVDHIDMNRSNNRWRNLRHCTYSQNSMNVKESKNNKSGYKNVYWHSQSKKWRARLSHKGKDVHLGNFDCKHKAAKSYNTEIVKYHGEFAYLNEIIND